MVVQSSSSATTLVSLDDQALKRIASWEQLLVATDTGSNGSSTAGTTTTIVLPSSWTPTLIRVPSRTNNNDNINHKNVPEPNQFLALPPRDATYNARTVSVDQALGYFPTLMERNRTLLQQAVVVYNYRDHHHQQQLEQMNGHNQHQKDREDKILYVQQGEVAHAVPSQCDVLVSDKATTCHIVIFKSQSGTSKSDQPLVSLTHLDGPGYNACLHKIVQHHKRYHRNKRNHNKRHSQGTGLMVQMDIHVMGGFDDETSRNITRWFLHALAAEAAANEAWLQVTLQTCAVTQWNERGDQSPIGRGLAIRMNQDESSTTTTQRAVHLAQVDVRRAGPVPLVRSARLWSRSHPANQVPSLQHQQQQKQHRQSQPPLICIHTEETPADTITIQPFYFEPMRNTDYLLSLPDDVLIQYTSTSPACEEDDFVPCVRATLAFMKEVRPTQLFGPYRNQQPITFRRSKFRPNEWKPLSRKTRAMETCVKENTYSW